MREVFEGGEGQVHGAASTVRGVPSPEGDSDLPLRATPR